MEFFTQFARPAERERARAGNQRRSGRPSIYEWTRENAGEAQRLEEERRVQQAAEEARRQRDLANRSALRRAVRAPSQQTPAQRENQQNETEAWQGAMVATARASRAADADYAARAAEQYTGAPQSYVRTLIRRETAYTDDPKIRPSPLPGRTEPRSSAVGYGQFLDDDGNRKFWRQHLPRYLVGVNTMSDEEIMAYREDGPISAAMIGHRANQAASAMAAAMGRPVTHGEVYLEHFLGASAAVATLRARDANPNQSAASFMAKQRNGAEIIGSHRKEFYDKNGRPRTLAEFVEGMTSEFPKEIYEVRPTRGTKTPR